MKRLALALGLSIAAAACTKSLTQTPAPTNQIQAEFNPAASPPVLPTPTDLATDPTTGRLAIPINPALGGSDQTILLYLNSLTGYPSDSPGEASFSTPITASTATAGTTVLVLDKTASFAAVSGVSVGYFDPSLVDGGLPTLLVNPPAGGWTPGHVYDIALTNGITGPNGGVLVGTPTFALVRSTTPLATCPNNDFTSTSCTSVTSLIPSGADAVALEQIRLDYAAAFAAFEAAGTPRANIPLLWQFGISSDVTMDFNPNGPSCPPNVPSPNVLAQNPVTGQVTAPICPNQTLAQQEFTRDYLNNLNGFPVISPGTAPVLHGDLSASSLSSTIGTLPADDGGTVSIPSVVTIDLTALATGSSPADALVPGITPSYVSGTLVVGPPATGWTKGHTYAIAVMSGMPGGVTTDDGGPVVSNDQFALLESTSPLAQCADGSFPSAGPPATTCPSTLTQVILSDAQASQAEEVREALAPVLAAIQAVTGFPVPSGDGGAATFFGPIQLDPTSDEPVFSGGIAMAWAFGITSQAEVQYNLSEDATQAIVPFPNDLLFVGGQADGGHVNIPVAPDAGAQGQTIEALDTLDGFSLTAPATPVTNQLQALNTLTDGVTVLTQLGGPDGGAIAVAVAVDGGGVPGGIMALTAPPPDGGAFTFEAVTVCVNCDSTPGPDGGYAVDALQILPAVPLPESTPYAAYVQTTLMGSNNVPVAPSLEFALIRMANPLFDGTHATVSGLSDAQAQQLEPIRQSYAPMFDALAAAGLPRAGLAMAWNYHTQSVESKLAGLYSLPSSPETAPLFPTVPEYAVPIDSLFAGPDGGVLGLDPLPHNHLAHIVAGSYYSQSLLTGVEGTFNPDPAQWATTRVPFLLSIPAGTAPTNGWPVVIFGHGITRSRLDMLSLANAYAAAGFAVEAEDIDFHGDRSFCVGSGEYLHTVNFTDGGNAAPDAGDNFACHQDPSPAKAAHCDEDTTSLTYGRCIGAPHSTGATQRCDPATVNQFQQGVPGDLFCFDNPIPAVGRAGYCDEHDPNPVNWHCEGADWRRADPTTGADDVLGQPLISGWDILSLSNLFQTRDNLRQQVVDLAQAENMLVNADTEGPHFPDGGTSSLNDELTADGIDTIDTTQIHYTGQSLGGILGTLFTSVSTNVQNSVLNVAGGGFVQILQNSEAFHPVLEEFQAGYAAQGVVVGSAGYDTLIHTAEWILDADDSRVAAEYLGGYQQTLGGPAPPSRNVAALYIQGDQVVPNSAEQDEIYCAENAPEGPGPLQVFEFTPTSETTDPTGQTTGLDLGDRHGFLLNFTNPGITAAAQSDAATFIKTGVLPTNQ